MFRHPCPYTSRQNGKVERKHRHIIETSLTLLAQSKLPLKFWWEACETVVYLLNRLPTYVFNHKSLYAKLYQNESDYSLLKTFGCTRYPHLRPYNNHKL